MSLKETLSQTTISFGKYQLEKHKVLIAGILSLLLTILQITGWQISMDYGSSLHRLSFFQNIGSLEPWQCLLWGIFEFAFFFPLIYFLFSRLEMREGKPDKASPWNPKWVWLGTFLILGTLWLVFLWGCYPGFYNYDIGNQLPQFLYEEVSYNAHHPLLHTLFVGGIIALGYRITGVDITFGVFLYNAVQMLICAACLSYGLSFIYRRTRSKIYTGLALAFFALCPPIVMLAMSTTKDVLCYSLLSVAFIQLLVLFEKAKDKLPIRVFDWILPGIFLLLSCLIRKNIIYALVVFAFFSLLLLKQERKKQLLLYVSVILLYFVIDKSLLAALDAIPGEIDEALCVPYQQLARLYSEEGADAFTAEEYELLSKVVNPEALAGTYDPVMADHSKAQFNPGLEVLLENKGDYVMLWLKKAFEYPKIFIDSFLYNTYQAWYPGTSITELRGIRYFDITSWNYDNGTPHWQGLFDFYEGIRYGSFEKIPVVRLLFNTGTMFWIAIITLFYGFWKKDRGIIIPMLLILLVAATNLCGPVSDVRYYLFLFYLAPVFLGLMLGKAHKPTIDKKAE